jgi:hypothetical protein
MRSRSGRARTSITTAPPLLTETTSDSATAAPGEEARSETPERPSTAVTTTRPLRLLIEIEGFSEAPSSRSTVCADAGATQTSRASSEA